MGCGVSGGGISGDGGAGGDDCDGDDIVARDPHGICMEYFPLNLRG